MYNTIYESRKYKNIFISMLKFEKLDLGLKSINLEKVECFYKCAEVREI
jgi:hypothetical protein